MKQAAPHWPAMMRKATAAAYLDMGEAAFEREIAAGRIPSPVKFGGRDHWKRSAIDACLDRLTGDDSVPDYRQELRDKCAQKAA